MSLNPEYGQTLLDEEEVEALTPAARSVLGEPVRKADLYDLEQRIQEEVADRWWSDLFNWNIPLSEMLNDHFVRELHRDLYSPIWTWGGRQRSRLTNIGIDPELISVELRTSLENLLYRWQTEEGITPRWLGIATHAELVRIHPFVDGNGRATRLLADLVHLATQDALSPIFTYDWEIDRSQYIGLLREYDKHRDPSDLAKFVPVIDIEAIDNPDDNIED